MNIPGIDIQAEVEGRINNFFSMVAEAKAMPLDKLAIQIRLKQNELKYILLANMLPSEVSADEIFKPTALEKMVGVPKQSANEIKIFIDEAAVKNGGEAKEYSVYIYYNTREFRIGYLLLKNGETHSKINLGELINAKKRLYNQNK